MRVAIQNVLFLVNPNSGAQQAVALERQVAATLRDSGFTTTSELTVLRSDLTGTARQRYQEIISHSDAVVFASGDGTLTAFLDLLAESEKPVYLLPMGNESLFAREYGMTRDAIQLVEALRAGRTKKHFFASFAGQSFLSMLEVDALSSPTVERFARWRTGGSSNFKYMLFGLPSFVGLIARSLFGGPVNPCVSVSIDGRTFIDREQGSLIIAKTPSYAGGIKLAPEAEGGKPLLYVGFHERTTVLDQIYRAFCISKRVPAVRWSHAMRRGSGQEISITVHGRSFPFQADGERVDPRNTLVDTAVKANLHPRPILVLQPGKQDV